MNSLQSVCYFASLDLDGLETLAGNNISRKGNKYQYKKYTHIVFYVFELLFDNRSIYFK